MHIKRIVLAMALPLATACIFTACSHEDLSPKEKSTHSEATEKTSEKEIAFSITADISLPAEQKASSAREVYLYLDLDDEKHRPHIDFSYRNSNYQTKLYLRKKGSTNPKEIFSVTIENKDWVNKDPSEGKIKLSREEGNLLHKELPTNYPFAPADHFPKVEPKKGEQWEAAAIICVGDKPATYKTDPKSLAAGYLSRWPAMEVASRVSAQPGTGKYYNETSFSGDKYKDAFRQDGIWLVYPRVASFSYKDKAAYNANRGLRGTNFYSKMDIPFCADWTPVHMNEKGGKLVLGISLKAKSPGSILHYELNSSTGSARALNSTHRQTFRGSGGGAGGGSYDPTELVDNLETNAGTHYGALWYDQKGTTVHWQRGEWLDSYTARNIDGTEETYTYHRSMHNRLPIEGDGYRKGVKRPGVSQRSLDKGETIHVLYFLMPPYEGETVATPTTKFWLSQRKWADGESQEEYHNYVELSSPAYQLRKGASGTFSKEYINTTTRLKPNAIHHVSLQWTK